jgi:hypothetical protein
MKHIAACFVLLLNSLTLVAQSGARNEGQPADQHAIFVDLDDVPGNGCPIGMVASQGVWDHTIKVRHGWQEQSIQPFGQRIFLTLSDSHPAAIVAATVKVHGFTGKSHKLETADDSNAPVDATKMMKITFATSVKGGVRSDLYIPGFTAVSSIELLEVSYDGGRVWRIGGSGVCRVKPDPMMLIASQ